MVARRVGLIVCLHLFMVVDVRKIAQAGRTQKEDDHKTDLDHIDDMERRRISSAPSINGPNGRGARGRWAKGNGGGPGNPLVKQVQRIRVALLNAITPEDVQAIVKRLIQMAKKGSIAAAKIILERALGPAAEALDVEIRLTELENQLRESEKK